MITAVDGFSPTSDEILSDLWFLASEMFEEWRKEDRTRSQEIASEMTILEDLLLIVSGFDSCRLMYHMGDNGQVGKISLLQSNKWLLEWKFPPEV